MTVVTRDRDVEVRRQKRRWPAQYKLDILAEIDAAKATGTKGAVGAILLRENLYSSLITDWRKQRDAGALQGLKTGKVGRPAKDRTVTKLADSRRRVDELEAELATARELIEAQGKVSPSGRPALGSSGRAQRSGYRPYVASPPTSR